MLGQLSSIVMGFADTLMVGRYGTNELAASGFVNNILGLLIIGGMGFSYGLTPVVSALLGEGRVHSIAGKLKNGIFACSAVGLLMMFLAGLLLMGLPWLGLPTELLPCMRPYLFVLLLSLFPLMLFNAYKQFSDGIQDTSMPMWIMLIANILNVFGNWLLIFGHWGLPEMGLLGAGLATLLSRLLQLVLMVSVFHLTKHYRFYRDDFHKTSITKADQRELHRMGWPVALQLGMETASFSFSAIYVGWLGATALAAHQIMITISQLFFMLYYGLSAAVAVQVSYYRGSGEMEETRKVAAAGLRLCWLIALIEGIPLLLLRNKVGLLFTNTTEVVALVAMIAVTIQAQAASHIYRGNSTYTSDIIATWDGRYLYKGNSTYNSDILLTYDGKYLYAGRSTYISDIMGTWDGRYLYQGRSTYISDIIATWDGKYIYEGRSTYISNIMNTVTGKHVYRGRSTYNSDILYTITGRIPIPVLLTII